MVVSARPGVAGNYIDGRWLTGNESREVLNPSTGGVASFYQPAGPIDVDSAVHAARRAFEAGGWSNNPRRRSAALLAMADRLFERREELVRIGVAESGKRTAEMNGELGIAISELRYYAGLARTICGRVQEVDEGELSVLSREPIGVAAIIVPWNAPIALLIRSLAPALAAGCAVVIKAAPQTSLTNATAIRALTDAAELPRGILNSLNENGAAVGQALVAHAGVDAVSFTGSRETAGHIMRSAAGTLKRLNFELGGKSPAIVFADADLEHSVAAIASGITIAAGQQCTAISRVLVASSVADEVTRLLGARLAALRVGAADHPESQMGPVISEHSRERLLKLVAGCAGNAILRGRILETSPSGGWFLTPSLIWAADTSARIVQEEHFGPVVTVESFENTPEAIHKANATIYGLAASVWTQDIRIAQQVARSVKAGTVWINSHNKLFAEAETGGFKQSGLGRLHGVSALDAFLETKHVFQSAAFLPAVSLV